MCMFYLVKNEGGLTSGELCEKCRVNSEYGKKNLLPCFSKMLSYGNSCSSLYKVIKKLLSTCQFGGGCVNDAAIYLATS